MIAEDRFRSLCHAQIEGRASDAERAELAEVLRQDDLLRHRYVEQMRVHALLTWQHGRSQCAPVAAQAPDKGLRPVRWSLVLAGALAMVMVGLMAWWSVRPDDEGVEIHVIASDNASFKAGESRFNKSLVVNEGSMSFRTTAGAVVEVTGPAELDLLTPMHLRVIRGAVTADISDGMKGFVIDTPEARVVDLGTRFAVSTGGPKGTQVAVLEGKVEVYESTEDNKDSGPQVTLNEGEGIRIDTLKQAQRLGMVRLNSNARTLRDDSDIDLVSDVWDNRGNGDGNRFYGIVQGGMGDGAKAYTTRSNRVWRPAPGHSFPEELEGTDQICTIPSYRTKPELRLTMVVNQPCNLYVMADVSAPSPEWLKSAFTATGLMVQSGPWWKGSEENDDLVSFYVTYAVWKRRIDQAGTVELGAPQDVGSKTKPAMYGIVVKALP